MREEIFEDRKAKKLVKLMKGNKPQNQKSERIPSRILKILSLSKLNY